MKVIEEGAGDNPVVGKFRCTGIGNGGGGCKAKLEVNLSDLRRYQGTDMYGDPKPECFTFRCPTCHTLTDIKREKHPKGAQRDRVRPFTNKWKKHGEDDWLSIAHRRAANAGLDLSKDAERYIEFVYEKTREHDEDAAEEYRRQHLPQRSDLGPDTTCWQPTVDRLDDNDPPPGDDECPPPLLAVLNQLRQDRWVGKYNGRWTIGYLDARGVLQGDKSADTLEELAVLIEHDGPIRTRR